jgi:IclR family transcriptional regulator, pca regulon regulatory protein
MAKNSAAPPTSDDQAGPAWSLPGLREARYSQSLERGLAILSCFTPSRPVLGISDIADELEMSRSTTHRYVITLVALGFLEQGASRKYRLGLRVTDLGMSALNSTGLREHARPYLEELRSRTSHTAGLGVLDGHEVLFVDHLQSHRRRGGPEHDLHPGSRLPAHSTAVGKMLLATLPEDTRRRVISEIALPKLGPKTITTKKRFKVELEAIRESAFAVGDEEMAPKLYGIAAPIRNESSEVVAAVCLVASGPSISVEQMVDGLGPHLVSGADSISARLGYRRPDERG